MRKRRPLWQEISAKILPFSLLIFLIVSFLQLFNAVQLDRREATNQLNVAGEQFAQRVDQFVSALLDQIESIGENSIVINALIDLSGRSDYLPLYFETLGIFGNTDISIKLVDFQNKTVETNFFGETLVFPEEHQWFSQVLTDGKRWVMFDERGLFVAEPVLNHGLAEGAVLVLVPIELLVENLNNLSSGYQGDIADMNGIVLLSLVKSNSNDQQPANLLDDKVDISPFILSTQANIKTRILNPTHSYFSTENIFLKIVLQSLALIGISILLILFFSIKRVKEIITSMTGVFDKTIASGDLSARIDHEKWALELAQVGEQFNVMMAKLQSTTTSRDEIDAIFNSMSESVIVCDAQYQIVLSNRNDNGDGSESNILYETLKLSHDNAVFDPQTTRIEFEVKDERSTTLWRKSPLQVNGVSKGWLFVGSDITEIRRAQQQMQLLEMAFDSSSNGMIVVDATSAAQPIVFANKSFTDITGFSQAEVLGRKCNFLQGAETNPVTKKEISNGLFNYESIAVEILNYQKDGNSFWNQLSIDPVFNDQNEVTHFLGVIRDISELVKQREELRLAKEAAEMAAVVKSEFLATMSHEIRTPMNGVLGMLSLLMKTDLNNEQIHRAKLAHNSAKSLLSLINDILDFSKIEAGKLELESISFDLREMLGELAETLAFPAEGKNLEIILDVTGIEVSHIQSDPGRIRQILTNLIGNSIKFTEQGEIFIQVGLGEEVDGWRLYGRVVDSGIGIPSHKQETLFDAFSQVDASTTREYGGTGLGLAIVRSLCEMMGGNIRVMSEVGRGSVFEFDILVGHSSEALPVKPPVDITGLNTLVVDSNQSSLDVMRGQLKAWGANVSEAKTLEQAKIVLESTKNQSESSHFSIVMIASNRPAIAANELARFIRQLPGGAAIKIIGMTAMNEIEKTDAKAQSSYDFLFPKPVTCSDMCNAISTLKNNDDGQASTFVYENNSPLDEKFIAPANARLLVVDDNQINQIVALGLLEEVGLTADCAADGREALEMMQTSLHDAPYTLLLMDCQMPVMDGYEATRRIRSGEAGERYSGVTIIAMTANAMQGDRQLCIDAGMNDYLAKPIEFLPMKTKLVEWMLPEIPVDHPSLNTSEVVNMDEHSSTATPQNIDAIWDREDVLKRVANNEKLVDKLLTLYLADKDARLIQLRTAFEKPDLNEVAELAHTLKGVSANLSATKLNLCCIDLETALKDSDTVLIAKFVAAVEDSHRELSIIFTDYLVSHGAA